MSSTGLLIETLAALSIDETIEVEIPEVGTSQATVVWSSGQFFGCQFSPPIPSAAISAALLRSEIIPVQERQSAGVSQKPAATPDYSHIWPNTTVESRVTRAAPIAIAALAISALSYFMLTGDVVAILVIAAIAGLLLSLLGTMLVWIQNNAEY